MRISKGFHAGLCRLVTLAALVLGSGTAGNAEPPADPMDGPLTPEQAPRSFRLEPGLRLELVAAEPLVASPVALAFDERGRMFVAENRGYPTGPGAGQPLAGRIAMLEDTDGDGADGPPDRVRRRAHVSQRRHALEGGLIVTCAPDVLFLRDTDGDGKADERRVLFTGFATTGQHAASRQPSDALDRQLDLPHQRPDGRERGLARGPRPPAVVLKRTDFRFRPDGDAWEAADGGAQFGLTFDDFGRRFICYNRVQVQHVVIASKTLRRNPHLAFSETVQNCPAEMVAEPLKGHGAAARLFPISRNVTTADSHAGTFTAACAVTVLPGHGPARVVSGGVFSCDPTGNLVHFDRLEPRGATFSARRARDGVEFLGEHATTGSARSSSPTDPTEPSTSATCTARRSSTPTTCPVEIRKHTDFESGKTMGRIWRVVRDDAPAGRAATSDGRSTSRAHRPGRSLRHLLRDRDGWWRDTAHRLLLERRDPDAIEPLRSLAADPKAPPATVVHALHLLEALDGLTDDLLRQCARHPAAPVREHALQLVEPRLAGEPRLARRRAAPRRRRGRPRAVPGGDRPRCVPARRPATRRAAPGSRPATAPTAGSRAAVFSSLAGREPVS